MQSNLNYDLSYTHSAPLQSLQEAIIRYRNSFPGKCFANQLTLPVSESFCNVVDVAVKAFELCMGPGFDPDDIAVTCYDSSTAAIRSSKVCLSVEDHNSSNEDFWKLYERSIHVRGFGDLQTLKTIFEYLRSNLTENKLPTVTWEYMSGGERSSQEIKIERAKPILNEFYPWLKEDVYAYFDRFLASESSILVLLGPSGTAKTSFIRSMIWHRSLNTRLTYEEKLLETDAMFVDFIVGDQNDLLVVEDADLFLTSREHDGNKVMSKFLNVSDGLVNIGKKKIIFTANITEPTRIDNALLRAGRCFDCQIFRRLSFDEAVAASKAAGITIPTENRTYSIAELFADGQKPVVTAQKVGFAAR